MIVKFAIQKISKLLLISSAHLRFDQNTAIGYLYVTKRRLEFSRYLQRAMKFHQLSINPALRRHGL